MRLIAVLAPLPMGPTQESRKGLAVAHDCGTRVRVVGLVLPWCEDATWEKAQRVSEQSETAASGVSKT